jgi:hypothetical protein
MTIQGLSFSDATLAPNATEQERLTIALDRYAAIAPRPNAELKQNVILPAVNSVAEIGATIAWTSDSPSVISNTGVVTRPLAGSPDVPVKLSYVLTVGTLSSTPVEINFTVKAVVPGELLTVIATVPTGTTTNTVVGTNYATNLGLDSALFNLNFVKNVPVVAAINTAGQIRLYGDRATGNGNQLNFAIIEGYRITQIKISFLTASPASTNADLTIGSTLYTIGASDLTTQTRTYSDLDVTSFSIKNTHLGGTVNGQVWVSAFEITYQQVIA